MAILKLGGQARRPEHAVALAAEILWTPPASVAGGVEPDELGHRGDVGILAKKLLGLLVFGSAAVAGGHRVDKHKISRWQDRVLVGHKCKRRGR